MSAEITTVLAQPFTWTENPTLDLAVAFPTGASPAETTIPDGTYRVGLAPTTGSLKDFLRVAKAQLDTAIGLLGRAEVASVTQNARGRVVMSISAGTVDWTLSSDLAALLGFTATSYAGVASITATHLPRHFYTFLGDSAGESYQEATEIAARATTAGVVVGIQSGVKCWTSRLVLDFIPLTPTLAASADEPSDWSCWDPDAGGGAAVPWTLAELRRTALAQLCALTRSWGSVRSSTSEAYELVYLDPESLKAPQAPQMFPGLTVWRSWDVTLVHPCDATSSWLRAYATRA